MDSICKTLSKHTPVKRKSSKSNSNCCVYDCNSVPKKNPNLSFHRFPRPGQKIEQLDDYGIPEKIERRKVWENNLKMGKPISEYMHVCSKHFDDGDFITPNEDYYVRRVLKNTAVPTKHLPVVRSIKVAELKAEQKKKRLDRLVKRQQAKQETSKPVPEIQFFNEPERQPVEIEVAETLMELGNNQDVNACGCGCHVPVKLLKDTGIQTDTPEDPASLSCEASAQVNTSCFSISYYLDSEAALKILTGLPTFAILDLLIDLHKIIRKDIRVHRLSVKERILLVFLKLKLDLTYSALAIFFGGISARTAKRIFKDTVLVLAEILKHAIHFPSREEIRRNLPLCFDKFRDVRVVLDCTEVGVQSAKKLCCRIKTYSNYKKHHTVKFMTGVTPAGLISFVSKAYGGRASDEAIFEQSKLIDSLDPYIDKIMVDKGFLIDNICAENAIGIVRPPFLRKKKQFSNSESTTNASIASARVHIERVNARIKLFRVFRNVLPLHLVPLINEMFTLVCGLTNLCNPIISEKLFLLE